MPILERMVIIYPPFHIMLTEVNTIPTDICIPSWIAWHLIYLPSIVFFLNYNKIHL